MRFLVSPCAYKGTLSAWQLCVAIAAGIHDASPQAQVVAAPIADGGDGTLDALYGAVLGELSGSEVESVSTSNQNGFRYVDVRGPVDNAVRAKWLKLDDLAVVELAVASGLALMPDGKLFSLDAHTFGLGEVIVDALATKPRNLFICVGGSASTDGGAGMLSALGAKFLDSDLKPLDLGGGSLCRLKVCDLTAVNELLRRSGVESVKVAVDVVNPLIGEFGAAAIFGPQKGASYEQIKILDDNLSHFATVLEQTTGRLCRNWPGAGAAGGTAFGAAAALNADLISGFTWLAQVMNLEEKLVNCDVVISAEGSLDSQSLSGKAIGELSKLCAKFNKPLWVVPAIAQSDIDWASLGVQQVRPTALNGCPATAESVRHTVSQLITYSCE